MSGDANGKEDEHLSFFDWLEQPRQIFFISTFFILITVLITKLCRRRKFRHSDFRVRDPRKGHHWVHSDFIVNPSYCNVCETSLVRGVFCDTCWICVHDECENDGNKMMACKVMSLSERSSSMRHHWIKGNLPLCSKCVLCCQPSGIEPRLCDYRCVWCQETVHEGQCYAKVEPICNFGSQQRIILPPYCVTLKSVGWRGRRCVVIKSVKRPTIEDWRPILIIANPKSGGNEGVKLLRVFRSLLNPAQVIDLSEISPESALEFCRLVPNMQCRVLICGGDGTVGWVLDAIDKVQLPIRPHVGIHPLGTGNDLAKVLGWGLKYVGDEHEVEDVLYDLQNAQPVPFDRWKVSIHNSGFFKKPRLKVMHMNSYVSIGCDAQVVLNFHRHRETQPSLFTSRLINKLMYFIYGSRDVLEAQCKNLHKRVQLELDGKIIQLPYLEGIVVLNINSWSGGCTIWNNDNGNTTGESKFNDGYLEVAGLYSSLHIAKLQVNLADVIKLGRGKTVKISIHGSKQTPNIPMQVDGEPWEQGEGVVMVEFHGQALMLNKVEDT